MKNFYFNQVQLKGKLTSPEWSYTDNDGTMFFSSILQVKRSNGITDYIPIYFAEKVIKSIPKGAVFVKIVGIIKGEKTEGKISLFVLANKVELLSDIE